MTLYDSVTEPPAITWNRLTTQVLNVGGGGTWDALNVESPCVIFVEDGFVVGGVTYYYLMLYRGESVALVHKIGRAYSVNGIAWTKDPANPVMSYGVAWEWIKISPMTIIYDEDDDTLKMWYEGGAGAGIGYATSTDYGATWTKYASNPVLTKTGGAWDGWGVGECHIIRLSSLKYHIVYKGYGSPITGSAFGYASSEDGITWTKKYMVIKPVTEIGEYTDLRSIHILRDARKSKYIATYSDSTRNVEYLAWSRDLLKWEKAGVIFPLGSGLSTFDAVWCTAGYMMISATNVKMWYEGGSSIDGKARIGYAYCALDDLEERALDVIRPKAPYGYSQFGSGFQTDPSTAELRFESAAQTRGVDVRVYRLTKTGEDSRNDPIYAETFYDIEGLIERTGSESQTQPGQFKRADLKVFLPNWATIAEDGDDYKYEIEVESVRYKITSIVNNMAYKLVRGDRKIA